MAIFQHAYGIYINNVLVANTATEVGDPYTALGNPPGAAWPIELNNHVTIAINAGDTVEVRRISGPLATTTIAGGNGLTATLNIQKVGDPIAP